jgi:ATP-dependent RNA helicase DeaD
MNQFSELNIKPHLVKALEEMGFTTPTEIQAKSIPILLEGQKNFVGQAQTGTGKTAAFGLPLLQNIDNGNDQVQALILAPTRELAQQVESEIVKIAKFSKVRSTCIYGGASYEKQLKALKYDKPQVVVGTPGRVMDLIDRKALKVHDVSFCVLDEADEMLNMGFFEDVQKILDLLKENCRLVMFSATMPRLIMQLVQKTFGDYEHVSTKKQNLTNDNISQKYVVVREKYFIEALARIVEVSDDMYGMVFCRTKLEVKQVGDELKERGLNVEVLHGDMEQAERTYVMGRFKDRSVNLLVCTDVAARGIDVNNLTHVFNYGLPQGNDSYVHRIGRTGRAGLKGEAYTIVGPDKVFAIRRIGSFTKTEIQLAKLPTVEVLKTRTVEREITNASAIHQAILDKGDSFKIDDTFKLFQAAFGKLTKEELLKLMYTWRFNKVLRHYNSLAEIEIPTREKSARSSSSRSDGRSSSRDGGRDSGGYRGRNGRSGGGGRRDDRGSDRSDSRRDYRKSSPSSEKGERREKSESDRPARSSSRPKRPVR